jgi:exodeoxyribonuclease VII large subunit
MENSNQSRQEHLFWWIGRLLSNSPEAHIQDLKKKIDIIIYNIKYYLKILISYKQSRLQAHTGRLHALSPTAILERGYSITRTIPDEVIVMNSESVHIGQDLEVLLSKGSLICNVGRKLTNGKKNI